MLRTEANGAVAEARQVAGHAADEMARVEAVLADTESVTARVDSAARLAQRAFANPVVKVLAFQAGTVGGFRRLRQPEDKSGRPRPSVSNENGNGDRPRGSRTNGRRR